MSRIPTYRTGYGDPLTPPVVPPPSPGFTHNEVSNGYYCEGWTAPVYEPMNGLGERTEPPTGICTPPPGDTLNKYLNFPRRLEGETASAPNYEDIGLQDVKDALAAVYIPAGIAPDPVYGNYINLYKIFMDNAAVPGTAFEHACFPLSVCDPAEYVPGYLDPPVPFISFEPVDPGGGGGDPGMTGLVAATGISLTLTSSELCVYLDLTSYSRPAGQAPVIGTGAGQDTDCVDTTDCPEE